MPKPRKDDTEKTYITFCMSSPEMKKEFPDPKQRVAVCYSYWKNRHKKKKD